MSKYLHNVMGVDRRIISSKSNPHDGFLTKCERFGVVVLVVYQIYYNYSHHTLRLSDVWPNFPFTTSEIKRNKHGVYELPHEFAND